jgi:hypothetical protein
MKADIANLQCVSAFELAAEMAVILHIGNSSAGTTHGVSLTTLQDVLYLPDVLEPGQSICLVNEAFVPEESILDRWSLEFLKSQRQTGPQPGAYDGEVDANVISDPVCILGNLFSRNFGHWTEELLKVAILEHARVDCRYVMPTLPRFARESLQVLGVDASRVLTVDVPTVFRRALFTTTIHHGNLADYPGALWALRTIVDARLGETRSRFRKRLWLERGSSLRNGGSTLNRDQVYPLLNEHGFDIVDMAEMSIGDQIAAARAATAIAGPHGAQFVHCQFMPPSSTVVECFSPVHVNPSILQICRVLGHSYHQVVARSHLISPYAFGRECLVDCDHLRLVLDRL